MVRLIFHEQLPVKYCMKYHHVAGLWRTLYTFAVAATVIDTYHRHRHRHRHQPTRSAKRDRWRCAKCELVSQGDGTAYAHHMNRQNY